MFYTITIEDVFRVAKEENISFSKVDLRFIEDKIGDFMGAMWYDAVTYALKELKNNKKSHDI